MRMIFLLLFGAGLSIAQTNPYSCPFSNVSSVICTHSLGTSTPLAACFDTNGSQMGGSGSAAAVVSAVATSANSLTLTFTSAVSGTCLISTGGQGLTGAAGPTGNSGAVNGIQNQGTGLPVESTVNFAGAGVNCVDAPPVTTCTVPATGLVLTPPVQANWTAFNTFGMVMSPTYTSSRWEFTTNAVNAANLQGLGIAVPATPYSKVLRIWPLLSNVPYSSIGIGWANGTAGSPGSLSLCEYITADPSLGAGGSNAGFPPTLAQENWTSTTVRSSIGTLTTGLVGWNMQIAGGIPQWWRLSDDGTNRACDISFDGQYWMNVYSAGHSNFLTPTQLVVTGNSYNSSKNVKVILDSYQ